MFYITLQVTPVRRGKDTMRDVKASNLSFLILKIFFFFQLSLNFAGVPSIHEVAHGKNLLPIFPSLNNEIKNPLLRLGFPLFD